MQRHLMISLACAAMATAVFAACSSDDSGTTTNPGSGTGGSSAAGGSAGSAGSAGAAGGPPDAGSGACTNQADFTIISSDPTFQADVQKCATDNMGASPATKNCIITQTGLSDACATCFGDTIKCAAQKCMMQCIADPNGQSCKECRAQNCDPSFVQCSGIPANSP